MDVKTCGCTWGGPGVRCSAGYALFKHAWELYLCLTGPGFLDLDVESRDQLWSEYERARRQYASHLRESEVE